MGNWRTVNIQGTISPEEAKSLIAYLSHEPGGYCFDSEAYKDGVTALCFTSGLSGLGKWVDASGKIDAAGNLAERNFTVTDVAHDCKLLSAKYPSLSIRIDCGCDFEVLDCVASIYCDAGHVKIEKPAVSTLQPLDDDIRAKRLIKSLQLLIT